MRRQRKIHSLRRHYNEPNVGKPRSEKAGVRWAPEPKPASTISSASRRNSSNRSSSGWYKATSVSVDRKPPTKSSKSKGAAAGHRNSLGLEPNRSSLVSRQPTGLCARCFEITLHQFQDERVKRQHHRNFVELVNSAKTCVLCFIIAKQAPIPPPNANFSYDGTRHITLSITNRKPETEFGSPGLALDKLMVYLPTTRLSDRRALTLPTQAQLIAGRDSQAAHRGDIVGRRTFGGTNILCAVNWLAECVMTHRVCRKSTDLVGSLMYAVPPRLLDLGFNDSYAVRLVETDHNFVGPYVALSYTRGTSKVFSTTEENFATRQKNISIEKFNKTFKEAITITRLLGFRYLWIDAYCIVMDSPEDRTKHVPRMGIIFHNAALTLSAAVSPSADEGLVRFKSHSSPEAKIPYRSKDGTPLGHFFVTSNKPRGFNEDITEGELNQRAWCLQARALSRRILHFGNDQLFWECDTGIWSEDSAIKCPADSILDPMAEWRASFLQYKRGAEPAPQVPVIGRLKGRPTSAALVIPKIYHLWYSLVAQYTGRKLPREKDKSSAIAGLAYIFACLISQRQGTGGPTKPRPDTYLCGLWQNDLPFGLIWSSGSFHKWRMKFAKYPSTPRAPSWSWLSVDGPLHWPDGVVFSSGSFTSRSFMKLLQVGSHYDRRTDHEFSTLRVRGKIALLSNLYGFRTEDVDWKRTARDYDLARHGGDHDKAEGPINMPCALFDSAEVARVWTMLHGSTIDRPSTGSSSAPSTAAKGPSLFGRTAQRSSRAKTVRPQLVHDQQKDFVALLVMPAGCTQTDCREHHFDDSRLSATLPLPADTAFRAKNNCGQGLGYALILYPSSMGEGLFRRVGIAQVRIADFATVERRRDREIVIV